MGPLDKSTSQLHADIDEMKEWIEDSIHYPISFSINDAFPKLIINES